MLATTFSFILATGSLIFTVTEAVPFQFKRSLDQNNGTSSATSAISAGTLAPTSTANVTTVPQPSQNTTQASNTTSALDPNATNCQLALPSNALTAEGLSTPWELLAPCSQSQPGQQAFAEAAVIDAQGQISIYHPLIIDQGKKPAVAPVVPTLAAGSQIALFFGFNGNTLTLVDTNGQDTNASPILKNLQCVNGLPGAQGDVFGQVSWCNTVPFWTAVNSAVSSGKLQVPQLGTDNNGNQCLSSRSFEIIDQDQSDNLPTKYLLLPDGSTVQFTAANQKQFSTATEIDNASDEALIADFVDPVIGCTPFQVASIDDPGSKVSSLATQELQALLYQQEPIAIVPLNDPDTLLTSNGQMSTEKTNAYRAGVNMPPLGNGAKTDEGSPTDYCNNMIAIQPPFLAGFQTQLTAATTPDADVGNNLFTFLANRFLQSITNLNCPNTNIPITCTLDANGVATACSITALTSTGNGTTVSASASGVSSLAVAKSTASDLAPSSAFTLTATHSRHIKSHAFGSHTAAANPHTNAPSVATTAVASKPSGNSPDSTIAPSNGGGATTSPSFANTAGAQTTAQTSLASGHSSPTSGGFGGGAATPSSFTNTAGAQTTAQVSIASGHGISTNTGFGETAPTSSFVVQNVGATCTPSYITVTATVTVSNWW